MPRVFEQSYFTSCRSGISRRGPGYQTKAISSGINEEARYLIEAFADGYHIPKDRDQNSEEGQPVRLKSFSLGNGQWCVSLTRYRKVDWTGTARGNFFAHSLVCSHKDFIEFGANPFRLYHSGCFKEEDARDITELQPLTVELAERPIKASLDGLRRKVGDEMRLRQMIDAFLESISGTRPVIIIADPDDVLALLEGIITILPLSIRAQVSFSSYEASKPPIRIDNLSIPGATNLMVCSGATGLRKTGQDYSDIDFDHSFLIFDFENNRFSKVSISTKFSAWISREVFKLDDAAVEGCSRFLSLYDLTVQNLDHALAFYLAPGAVNTLNHDQMRVVLEFAESESRTVKQAEASVEKLMDVAQGSGHDLSITAAALGIATQHGLASIGDVYPRYLRLLIGVMKTRDRNDFSVLLNVANGLPAQYRAQLVADTSKEKGIPDEYLLELVGGALKLGSSAYSRDQAELLFEALKRLLNGALEKRNDAMTEGVLRLGGYLQKKEQIRLAYSIESGKGAARQLALIENALGLLPEAPDPEIAERFQQRATNLFEAAVREMRLADALQALLRVCPLLPPSQRRAFISHCLDNQLDLLWQALRRSAGEREVSELASHWLRLLLENELVAELPVNKALQSELESLGPWNELLRQLASYGIQGRVIKEERRGRDVKLAVRDSQKNDYAVRQAGKQLQVRRLNSDYAKRLGRILEGYLATPSGDLSEREVIWEVIVGELKQGRIGLNPPGLFQQLCTVVSQRKAGERIQVIRVYLAPLLAGVTDKKEHKRILIESVLSAASEARPGDISASDLRELLRQLEASAEDVRERYSRNSPIALFEFYWELIGAGRDRSRIINELVTLYQSRRFDLFERLARQTIESQNSERAAFVIDLLPRLQSLLDDAARFTALLEFCRWASDHAWPKFVSEIYAFLRDKGAERGVALLAKQCVARMRELMPSGERITKLEDEVIDHWLNNSAAASEQTDIDAVLVFREVQQLRCDRLDLGLFATSLQEYQSRKDRLATTDFRVAALNVLREFARCETLAGTIHWDCVEEVARRNQGRQPIGEFSGLIEAFLNVCVGRKDYPDLLVYMTLRWILDWDAYQECKTVLRTGYSLLKNKKLKTAYEERVSKRLERMSEDIAQGSAVEKGVQWWLSMIEQPREKGFFGWLLGR
jgi:hypothetical protein